MDPMNGMNLAVLAGVITDTARPGPEGLQTLRVLAGDPALVVTVYVPDTVACSVPAPGTHSLLRGVVWPQNDAGTLLDLVVTRITGRRPGRDRPGMSTVALGGRTCAPTTVAELPDGRLLAGFTVELLMSERSGTLDYAALEPDVRDVDELPVGTPLLALGRLEIGPMRDRKGHIALGFNPRIVEMGDANGAWRIVEQITAAAAEWEEEEEAAGGG